MRRPREVFFDIRNIGGACVVTGFFGGYLNRRNEIRIPNNITAIGDEAFENCKPLKTIMISDSVSSIGKQAFSNCINLKTVLIPDSVLTVGMRAFFECRAIESIIIPDGPGFRKYGYSECRRRNSFEIMDYEHK